MKSWILFFGHAGFGSSPRSIRVGLFSSMTSRVSTHGNRHWRNVRHLWLRTWHIYCSLLPNRNEYGLLSASSHLGNLLALKLVWERGDACLLIMNRWRMYEGFL